MEKTRNSINISMRHIVLYILYLCASTVYAQDSLIISQHRFINKELMACKQSKNQLVFLDSLILLTITERPPVKGSTHRFFKIQNEKLVIYHIDAGWLYRLRGNFDQAHKYLDMGGRYLDSLKLYDLYDDELKFTIGAYDNVQRQICYDTYQKDTTLFYAWDCAKFFPELNEEEIVIDTLQTISDPDTNHSSTVPKVSHYGKIYLNDTLRFDNRFVLDSISADFFHRTKKSILSKLSYKSFSEGMRLIKYDQADTIIIKIQLYSDSNKISRECSVLYSSCHDLIREYYLSLFSTMEFGGGTSYLFWSSSVCFYIPIIIKPETPNNYNRMDRVFINDDHFLIEYEKLRPIDPK